MFVRSVSKKSRNGRKSSRNPGIVTRIRRFLPETKPRRAQSQVSNAEGLKLFSYKLLKIKKQKKLNETDKNCSLFSYFLINFPYFGRSDRS